MRKGNGERVHRGSGSHANESNDLAVVDGLRAYHQLAVLEERSPLFYLVFGCPLMILKFSL